MYASGLTCAFIGLLLAAITAGSHEGQAEKREPLSVLLLSIPLLGHVFPLLALGEELVRRGHSVSLCTTVVKGVPNKQAEMAKRVGIGFIDAGPPSKIVGRLVTDEAYKLRIVEEEGFLNKLFRISDFSVVESIVMSDFVSKLNATTRTWDVVIAVEYFYPLLACIQESWGTRAVVLNTKLQMQYHTLPPWPFPSGGAQTDNLTFFQRLKNQFWGPVLHQFFKYWTVRRIRNGAWDLCQSCSIDYIVTAPSTNIPQIISTAIGLEFPRPIQPLAEYVGPLISQIPQSIPSEMNAWLDSHATGNVIYISMGSLFPLTTVVAKAIVAGVMATNYSALWSLRKTNSELVMRGVTVDSRRILIAHWTPQVAVINHRAVGLAIMHGGMSGLHEVLLAGLPTVLVPLTLDQFSTTARVQHAGAGLVLDFRSISSGKMTDAIRRIDSVIFREAAKRLGRVVEHAGGADRAADLVEFYADAGYEHLVPVYARHNWSWVQYYNVDVYGAVLVCGGVIVGCLGMVGRYSWLLLSTLWTAQWIGLKTKGD